MIAMSQSDKISCSLSALVSQKQQELLVMQPHANDAADVSRKYLMAPR